VWFWKDHLSFLNRYPTMVPCFFHHRDCTPLRLPRTPNRLWFAHLTPFSFLASRPAPRPPNIKPRFPPLKLPSVCRCICCLRVAQPFPTRALRLKATCTIPSNMADVFTLCNFFADCFPLMPCPFLWVAVIPPCLKGPIKIPLFEFGSGNLHPPSWIRASDLGV